MQKHEALRNAQELLEQAEKLTNSTLDYRAEMTKRAIAWLLLADRLR